jgi:hypothetical protein
MHQKKKKVMKVKAGTIREVKGKGEGGGRRGGYERVLGR